MPPGPSVEEAAMPKRGRPFEYQTDVDRPVTVSLRIPRDLYNRMEAYRRMHQQSITELLLDGLKLRLDTPADPRDILLSDDNTVIQEVQGMIRAAVQAEIGKLSAFLGPDRARAHLVPELETTLAPTPTLSYDDNTVLQKETETARKVTQQDYIPSYRSNTVIQQGGSERGVLVDASVKPLPVPGYEIS